MSGRGSAVAWFAGLAGLPCPASTCCLPCPALPCPALPCTVSKLWLASLQVFEILGYSKHTALLLNGECLLAWRAVQQTDHPTLPLHRLRLSISDL